MARRYRRTGRYSRRLKTVKYSNETMCASKDVSGYTKMTLVATTTSSMTPDLYEILRLLGKERISKRFERFM